MNVTLIWWPVFSVVVVCVMLLICYKLIRLKRYKTAMVVAAIVGVINAIKPFRLTVDNTATVQAEQATFERHQQLPGKVEVESSSFSEVLAKSAETNRRQNAAVRQENLGESQ